MIHITKAELLEEGENFCGIKYEGAVKDVIKGADAKKIIFVASEALTIDRQYIIFLDSDEQKKSRDGFFRGTPCKKAKDGWYFWAGLGRRYFSIQPEGAADLKGNFIIINKYNYFKDGSFISNQNIPKGFEERFSHGWFMYVEDLRDMARTRNR
jgi:hypothetical protein